MRPPLSAAIDQYLLPAGPTAANPPHAAAVGKWDRQTDGRTPYRFIDPALHTMRAVTINAMFLDMQQCNA